MIEDEMHGKEYAESMPMIKPKQVMQLVGQNSSHLVRVWVSCYFKIRDNEAAQNFRYDGGW